MHNNTAPETITLRRQIEKAERVYSKNETWRNQLNKSTDPRQFLKMFMEHWLLKIEKKSKIKS